MGYSTHYNYCVNAADGDCLNSSTGYGLVTVINPDATQSVFYYLDGTLAASTEQGTPASAESDTGPDLITGTLLPAWTSDTGGARSAYAYDQLGNLTSSTDPLNNVTTSYETPLGESSCTADATAQVLCSSSEQGPGPVSAGAAITPPVGAPPPGVTFAQFDNDGNQLYATTGVYPPGGTTATSVQTDYTLFKNNSVNLNGTVITCAVQPPSASLPCADIDELGNVTQYGYNQFGDLTSQSGPDGNGTELATTTSQYDGDGENVSTTSPNGNVSGATPAVTANFTTTTAYDADGRVTTTTQAGGSAASVTARGDTYSYDGNGNQNVSHRSAGQQVDHGV